MILLKVLAPTTTISGVPIADHDRFPTYYGLIFQSRRFRAACRDYRLRQEFITPYTSQQNGLVERFFRSLKEERLWLHNLGSFTEARAAITKWIQWYNVGRPNQSLGYRSPRQFRELHTQLVA